MNNLVKFAEIPVAIIVFLAWLWIGLKPTIVSQGWGGDYAGYIAQARNLVQGIPQNQTYYLYNPANPYLAPPAYPMGFPVSLAPFVSTNSIDVAALCRVMGFQWWLLGVAFFFFARRFVHWASALGAATLLLFNPYMFEIKRSILPDLLFAFLNLAALYAYMFTDRTRWRNLALIGVLLLLSCLVRYNGLALVICLAFDQTYRLLQKWAKTRQISKPSAAQLQIWGICLASVLLFYALNQFVFQMPANGSYFDQFRDWGTSSFHEHLNEAFKNINQFFFLEPSLFVYGYKHHDDAALIGGALALSACTVGLFLKGHEGLQTLRLYLMCFLLLLIVWPQVQGFRYLLPVFPVLFLFGVIAIDRMRVNDVTLRILKWAGIPILLWGAYQRIDEKVYVRMQEEDSGAPEHAINQTAFRYVQDSLPTTARFAFHQPLIFGLYAQRPAMRWGRFLNEDQLYQELKQHQIDYLMVNAWVDQDDTGLQNLVGNQKGYLEKVWSNERNTIFKIK